MTDRAQLVSACTGRPLDDVRQGLTLQQLSAQDNLGTSMVCGDDGAPEQANERSYRSTKPQLPHA
jgi:hypothetical protein